MSGAKDSPQPSLAFIAILLTILSVLLLIILSFFIIVAILLILSPYLKYPFKIIVYKMLKNLPMLSSTFNCEVTMIIKVWCSQLLLEMSNNFINVHKLL